MTLTLAPDALRRRCDPNQFSFQTTAEVEPLTEAIGQSRAAEAIRFGMGIDAEGYNLFAMGPTESGKDTLIRAFLDERAATEPVPNDIVYVNNFDNAQKPRALLLPAGRGQALRHDVDQLIDELRTALPAAFDSEEFAARKQVIESDVKQEHERFAAELRQRAHDRGVTVLRTPMGLAVAPVKDGEVISPDEFQKLPEEERKRISENIDTTQEEMQKALERLPKLEKEVREKVKALIRDVAVAAVGHIIEEVKKNYGSLPAVVTYLDALQQDVVDNVDDFIKPQESTDAALAELGVVARRDKFRRYSVNVLVDHGDSQGAPVIYESNPAFPNLIGRSEHLAQFGALTTDFTLIKAGALHKANGGYLVLDARNVLLQPFSWEALKRALRSCEIRIESLGQALSLASTVSLEPEPIPLQVKVVLLGERLLYYLLDQVDPEFYPLFKVIVDFEEDVERSEHTNFLVARLVAQVTQRERLRAFDRGGVAAVIERCARLANDSGKLSTHMGTVANLLREASYWAGVAGHEVVEQADVERAIADEERRGGRIRERVWQEIQRGTIMIDTRGKKVGQINGLSVLSLGRSAFGRPSRITAKTRLGKGEVIDIEREVQLGGAIHSKGVLILAGYLSAHYAASHPLSLSATLVFEQSYGMVDGDSASSAELYVLLSSLADLPILQSFAVTGSVNQNGEIQPIGGINEKIEGFFEVCKAQGLTGDQGVLMPASNIPHLMLSREVVRAVQEGQFRIVAVRTIDEGIEVLTGVSAGERDASGEFPKDSVNGRVESRLIALAERRIALGRVETQAPMAGAGDKTS